MKHQRVLGQRQAPCRQRGLGTQLDCQLVAIPAGLKWPVQLDIRQLDPSQLQTGSSKPQAGGVQAGIPAVLALQPEVALQLAFEGTFGLYIECQIDSILPVRQTGRIGLQIQHQRLGSRERCGHGEFGIFQLCRYPAPVKPPLLGLVFQIQHGLAAERPDARQAQRLGQVQRGLDQVAAVTLCQIQLAADSLLLRRQLQRAMQFQWLGLAVQPNTALQHALTLRAG